MLVLGGTDVASLIDRKDAIALATEAYRLQSIKSGLATRAQLVRSDPRAGVLILAGAIRDHEGDVLMVKTNVHAFPAGGGPRSWGGLLALWDFEQGRPIALLSSSGFNDHRTAAGFAAAAKVLARPEVKTLAIFGAGKSAPEVMRYLKLARPSLERILIAGRSPERVGDLVRRAREWPEMSGVDIRSARDPREAGGMDIVVTVTTSATPVLAGADVKAGALVILGGANRPDAREADDTLMRHAQVFVDGMDDACTKAGDICLARESGALEEARMHGEIGTILNGDPAIDPLDIRVFKSTGLAFQDLVLARHLVAKARGRGVGMEIDLA